MRMRFILPAALMTLVLSLSSCSPKNNEVQVATILTPSVVQQRNLSELTQGGVHIIQLGSHIRFIIPRDDFFEVGRPGIVRPAKRAVLLLLARTISLYTSSALHIKVNGYSDNTSGTLVSQQKYSFLAANAVAAYLWHAGVPLRQIQVKGFGATHFVANNQMPAGAAANRRVDVIVSA